MSLQSLTRDDFANSLCVIIAIFGHNLKNLTGDFVRLIGIETVLFGNSICYIFLAVTELIKGTHAHLIYRRHYSK